MMMDMDVVSLQVRERGGKPISMILHGPLLAAVSGFSFFLV